MLFLLATSDLEKSLTPDKKQKLFLKIPPGVSFASCQVPLNSLTTIPGPSINKPTSIHQDSSFNSSISLDKSNLCKSSKETEHVKSTDNEEEDLDFLVNKK